MSNNNEMNISNPTLLTKITPETSGKHYDSDVLINFSTIGNNIWNNPDRSVGIVILSGGEGSRLGYDMPKGTIPLYNDITLFDVHMNKIKNIKKLSLMKIFLFIMVSLTTKDNVEKWFKDFFKTHNQDDYCHGFEIFTQNSLPILTLSDKKEIPGFTSPNGNGGMYEVLKTCNNYPNVEVFNVISIDNVAAQLVDPLFLGCLYANQYDVLNKAIKPNDGEKVGGFTFYNNGDVKIEEYTDAGFDTNQSNLVRGNICNHLLTKAFIDKIDLTQLECHHAIKAAKKGMNTTDKIIKQELFIFDPFIQSNKVGVLTVERSTEFVPLKDKNDIEKVNTYIKNVYKI